MSETDDDSTERAQVDDDHLEPDDRTLTWWPIIGAAMVAALVVAVIVFTGAGEDHNLGAKTDGSGALVCPDTYEQRAFVRDGKVQKPWVPLEPSGVGGDATLVPDTAPSHVTLCLYQGSQGETTNAVEVKLSGHRLLESGLRGVTKDLSNEPKRESSSTSCTETRDSQDNYLLGFVFATGLLWVSVPSNDCLGVTNGKFVTGANLADRVSRAYGTRTWPTG